MVTVNLLTPGAMAALIKQVRPSHLVHLAWDATPGRFWQSPDNIQWCAASLELFRAFYELGGVRALGIGTCAEYDWHGTRLEERTTPRQPATLYGCAKNGLHDLLTAYTETIGASFAWGRLFWMYGPREAPGRLVSDLAAALAKGEPAVMGPGTARRDYLHVDDVGRALAAGLMSSHQGAFNVGSGKAVALHQIGEALAEAFGRLDLLRVGGRPAIAGEPPVLEASIAILRHIIGFEPRWSLADGMADVAAQWQRG
jgi:nucleoside-diphosphate-sugar epimerase